MHTMRSTGLCLVLSLFCFLGQAQNSPFNINLSIGGSYNSVKAVGRTTPFSNPISLVGRGIGLGFDYQPSCLKSILVFENSIFFNGKHSRNAPNNRLNILFTQRIFNFNLGSRVQLPVGPIRPYAGFGLSYGVLPTFLAPHHQITPVIGSSFYANFFGPNTVNQELGWYLKTGFDIPWKQYAFFFNGEYSRTSLLHDRKQYVNSTFYLHIGARFFFQKQYIRKSNLSSQ